MHSDAATSRSQLLDAAEALFARKGFEATTVKEIGRATGLNPALIYYYFAGKEELYKAVLERMVSSLVTRGGAALDLAGAPEEAIRALVRAQVEFLLGHPHLPRLLFRELVDHDAEHAQEVILQLAAGLFDRLCKLIKQGQASGVFRKELEPRFAAVSTVSQVAYFILARPAIGVFFGRGPGGVPDETVREFGRHAGDFAVHALTMKEQPA